jgi:hypothetical protein
MQPRGQRHSGGWLRRLRVLYAKNRCVTPRRLFNYLFALLEMRAGRTRLISRPYELCIDVSNKCNLTCPFCPTGRRETGRGKGNISYATFASIVDELAPTAFTLELYNWGEAFFNPELPRLIEHAYRKRLVTLISSNLSFPMKEDYIRTIIRSGLTHLTAAVDGADQQSYEVYRRGGSFDLVVENLRTFVRLKRELNSDLPRLCWQYLIFAHNEDRVDAARRLADDIGLDKFAASGGLYDDPSWAPKGDYAMDYLGMHPNRCAWLWTKAVFHWDGGLASCCMGFDKHDDFADWEAGSFARLWNNEKFVAARRIWTEPQSPLPAGHFCTECDKVRFYRGMPLHSKMKPAPALRQPAPDGSAAA